MPEVPIKEFLALVRSKKLAFAYTTHAGLRSIECFLPRQVCEQDIINESPALVMEQVSEIPHERKFDVYYHQKPGVFRRYVVTLNDSIRLITLMHTSKDIQNLVAGEDNKR